MHRDEYDIRPSQWGEVKKGVAPVGQNYVTAGTVIPLVGHTNGDILGYYNDPLDMTDEFIQHHATSYRRWLEELCHLPATTEDNMRAPNGRAP